jgi:molybdopterin biosynthesis enzyme MoaB
MQITPRGMLSRAEAVFAKYADYHLPGSPKSIRETLDFILPAVEHGLDMLQGNDSECARS